MIIKVPPIYDVSHWKEIPDFSIVSPRPELFITKATEHTSFIDQKFPRFFQEAARVGWQRGCYHFHRKGFDPVRQARHFCDFIRPHITPKDFLILDVEEGGEKASQLWAWLEYVHEQFPQNHRIIYGSKVGLDPIPMTAGEREYFRKIPIWTAGYPWFPDLFNSVPVGYVPDQTKWGPVWLWQYSAHGAVTGIKGDVDLNMATPAFAPILFSGDAPPPPVEEPTGATMYKVLQALNMRSFASFTAPIVGVLMAGDIITVAETVNGLHRITAITRLGENVPMPTLTTSCWCSAGAAYVQPYTPPVDPQPSAVGRVVVSIEAKIYDAAGVLVGSKVIELDEPMEGVG